VSALRLLGRLIVAALDTFDPTDVVLHAQAARDAAGGAR
jgi:hypothetical protein